MHVRIVSVAVPLVASLLSGCAAPSPQPLPPESTGNNERVATQDIAPPIDATESLLLSFVRQIEATATVHGVEWTDPVVTFTGPDGSGGESPWRVVVETTNIDTQPDGSPYRGTVFSSWYRDGVLIEYSTEEPTLPDDFGDMGLLQQCWALWDPETEAWGWV